MWRIQVDPDQLRALSAQLQRHAAELMAIENRLGSALGRLDWKARQRVGIEGRVAHALSQARSLADQAEEMSRSLAAKAQAFEEADRQGVMDLNDVIEKHPIPTPVPTPAPTPDQEEGKSDPIRNTIGLLDDLLKPIDWISDRKKATKVFRETLKQLGRILNSLTGKRGHVKLLEELADVLTGAQKVVSATSALFALRDFKRYFAGELTNQEIARTAIEKIIPVPFIDDKVADWMSKNVPNPNGKWRGLVSQVK